MAKHARPQSIPEALALSAVDLVDVAQITGLSYCTILTDVHLGELCALRHRKRYTVTHCQLVRYLVKLGFTVPDGNATTTTDTSTE